MAAKKTVAKKKTVGTKFPAKTPAAIKKQEAEARRKASDREVQLAQIDGQFGNNMAFDRDRIISETKFFIGIISQSILEVGSRLLRLKEHLPHGEFQPALEEIGIHPREARRMMQATAKFTGTKAQLASLGKTKLLELMVEDDEELEALADGGTIAGLSLDDVDRMSAGDLRKNLRKERQKREKEAETNERLLDDKNKKIDELAKELNNGPVIPTWPKLAESVSVETTQAAGRILLACDQLEALQDHILNGDYEGMTDDEAEHATEFMAVGYGEALIQAHTRIGELMDMYQESLSGYTESYEERKANISDNK
ncbi:MAG: hypothetical protein AB2604_10710 [Candidatus Thiodiazotropha taylori]